MASVNDAILRGSAAAESPHAGGKARALARAEQGGLPVPPWFVLSARACLDGATREQIAQRIEVALRELAPHGDLLAVRSSASDEDGAEHSFAGQLESFLNVAPDEVPAKIEAVWR